MSEFINTIDTLGDDAVIDSIIQRNITEFKDDAITTLGDLAFYECRMLTNIELPILVSIGKQVFQKTGLVNAYFPRLETFIMYPFPNCDSLKSAILPKVTQLTGWDFGSCASLEKVDLGSCLSIGGGLNFQNCNSLTKVILRTNTVCSALANPFLNTPINTGTGYIYVPRVLVDSYKAATNWSNYAAQFRALEDYTVDGTITGELDETKI